MKDSVKEFENLNQKVEVLFESLSFLNPNKWFSDKSSDAEANRNYSQNSTINQYLQSIESGEECSPNAPNQRFHSEPGSNSATFYSIKNKKLVPTGFVKDIKPFLANSGFSKKMLRCYDLSKDRLKIGWLFNGEFNADILDWDKKKRKVIFQGQWKNGLFGGISYSKHSDKAIESPLSKEYYILKKHQEIGPYTAGQIIGLVEKGKLSFGSIIRPIESTDYQYVSNDKNLAFLLQKPTPKTTPKKPNSNPAGQLG